MRSGSRKALGGGIKKKGNATGEKQKDLSSKGSPKRGYELTKKLKESPTEASQTSRGARTPVKNPAETKHTRRLGPYKLWCGGGGKGLEKPL